MEDYKSDPLMKWVIDGAKNFIDKKKKLIPDRTKMDLFLDTHNKIKKLCEGNGYEFILNTEHSEISPCDILLSLKMDYFGVSQLQMDEFKKTVNEILSAAQSFDISATDDEHYVINMMFDVYNVEIVDMVI